VSLLVNFLLKFAIILIYSTTHHFNFSCFSYFP